MILPIGTEDFGRVIRRKLDFVDKSFFIKEIFDDKGTDVLVITRPRRFGKTLNLSMLHHFLAENVHGEKTQSLFDQLKLAQYGNAYMQHQGKYPVISISFKDIKQNNFKETFSKLYELILDVYNQHTYLESSDKLNTNQRDFYNLLMSRKADHSQLENALKNLTEFIYNYHGIKPWLLVDEYDTPIQSAYINGYYAEIIDFMRNLFGATLKTNPYLEKAVITGILRVAKESLFSGLNNLKVYSLLNSKYSEYFGFTENEVDEILKKSDLSSKSEEIKQWYNGYKIGDTVIYNPWSIVNCVDEKGILKPYWVNTSDNQLIKDLLKKSSLEFKHNFELLIGGHTVEKLIDEHMVFQYLSNNSLSVWNLLLMAGYLKPVSSRDTDQGTFAQLAIPNKEVRNLYRQIVEQWLSNGYGIEWYNDFICSLLNGEMEDFKKHLEKVMLQITSYHDFAKEPEAFYQGLMLGFTVSLQNTGNYEIQSNRESGLGRFDIMIVPKDRSRLGIVIELKSGREKEDLCKLAETALHQINAKQYTGILKNKGIKDALKIGIGFCGKAFEMCFGKEKL